MNRKPNQGPYKVSATDMCTGITTVRECQTWAFACNLMREYLIANFKNVTVEFC